MSVDLAVVVVVVSLPEILACVPLPRNDDDDGERDGIPPCSDPRSLLRDVELESRTSCLDGLTPPRTSVPLIPSSPTVACRISSRNVHRPSRRSVAICFPVRIRASRDGGGMVLRHCEIISSVGSMDGEKTTGGSLLEWRSIDDGSVADRGGLTISGSGLEGGLLLNPESVDAESNDSVLACDPWNTRRPFADIEAPADAGIRRLRLRSSSLLRRALSGVLLLTAWLCSSLVLLSGGCCPGDRRETSCSA